MMTYEEYRQELNAIDAEIKELLTRVEYRKIELLGPIDFSVSKGRSIYNDELVIKDPELIGLHYKMNALDAKRDFIKTTGMMPPEV